MTLLKLLFNLLPPKVRIYLKYILGASGHRRSFFDRLKAYYLASGKKRLDNSAIEFIQRLNFSGIKSLNGLACLEIGSGYVLSDSLIMWLLGASKVISSDYNNIASYDATYLSIRKTNKIDLRKILSKFEGTPLDVDVKLELLFSVSQKDFVKFLNKIISYHAPYDSGENCQLGKFDFIYFVSVLEHISTNKLIPILRGYLNQLNNDGIWINHIDLKDHRSLDKEPLEFLSAYSEWVDGDEDKRGNRLRLIDWLSVLKELNLDTSVVFTREVELVKIPPTLHLPFSKYPQTELRYGECILASRRHI
jgi:hypothetical protein